MVGHALYAKAEAQAPVMTIQQQQAFKIRQMDPKSYAQMLVKKQWRNYAAEFGCLKVLWGKESAWNHKAKSHTYDYGIPQRHMSHNTPQERQKFLNDPHAQVRWGLGYIESRYSTPCGALKSWLSRADKHGKGGWY